MNYKEPSKILGKVKKATSIMLACHEDVDPDSIVSCLLAKRALTFLGKKVDIFSSEFIPSVYEHLDQKNEIEKVDFNNFDFSKYDIFFILDVNELRRLGITNSLPLDLDLVNIDHHMGKMERALTISDTAYGCTSEMVFYLLEDWKIKMTGEMLRLALTGILSDTDSFNYSASPRLFDTVSKLLGLGASYDEAASYLWRNNSLDQVKYLSAMLANMKVDIENRFAYSFLKYEDYKKFKRQELVHPTRMVADGVGRSIKDTDFGIVMLEHKKNEFRISIRSRRQGFASLPLVKELGGGGHRDGGGAMLKDLTFTEAAKKVLQTARKFAKNSQPS